MQMIDMPPCFADTAAVTIVIPESTTAAPTTTTDRHVTFLEDPKNIAWVSAAVVILCGIVCLMVYQSFRFGDYSRLARWCQRSRLVMSSRKSLEVSNKMQIESISPKKKKENNTCCKKFYALIVLNKLSKGSKTNAQPTRSSPYKFIFSKFF